MRKLFCWLLVLLESKCNNILSVQLACFLSNTVEKSQDFTCQKILYNTIYLKKNPHICAEISFNAYTLIFIQFLLSHLSLYNLPWYINFSSGLFSKRFYLLIFREGEGREKERERKPCARDTLIGGFQYALNWGPGLQPRHVS